MLFGIIVFSISLVGIFGIQRQPSYKGKSLRYWLDGYRVGPTSPTSNVSLGEADQAIRAMGTNIIPFLIPYLQARFIDRKERLTLFLHYKVYLPKQVMLWNEKNDVAIRALSALGPSAAPAVPELCQILSMEDGYAYHTWKIPKLLGDIGPAAYQAVPVLAHMLTNQAPPTVTFQPSSAGAHLQIRCMAAETLGIINRQPDIAVPALCTALEDSSSEVRWAALMALTDIGTNAHTAVPVLMDILQSTTGSTTREAIWHSRTGLPYVINALKVIDRNAAEKAGLR